MKVTFKKFFLKPMSCNWTYFPLLPIKEKLKTKKMQIFNIQKPYYFSA